MEKLSKVLCRGISCTNIETVREFVLKYEEENGKIPLHQWKEIFKALGYAEEFSGVVKHVRVVGQSHRHHGCPSKDKCITLLAILKCSAYLFCRNLLLKRQTMFMMLAQIGLYQWQYYCDR